MNKFEVNEQEILDQSGRLGRSLGPDGIKPRALNMKFPNFWLKDVKCHYKWTLN